MVAKRAAVLVPPASLFSLLTPSAPSTPSQADRYEEHLAYTRYKQEQEGQNMGFAEEQAKPYYSEAAMTFPTSESVLRFQQMKHDGPRRTQSEMLKASDKELKLAAKNFTPGSKGLTVEDADDSSTWETFSEEDIKDIKAHTVRGPCYYTRKVHSCGHEIPVSFPRITHDPACSGLLKKHDLLRCDNLTLEPKRIRAKDSCFKCKDRKAGKLKRERRRLAGLDCDEAEMDKLAGCEDTGKECTLPRGKAPSWAKEQLLSEDVSSSDDWDIVGRDEDWDIIGGFDKRKKATKNVEEENADVEA